MARENKTKYAILGLLNNQPMSGYDIKKAFEDNMGYCWSESYGQIYPIVNALAENGLAEKEVIHQDGKPDRHVYTITEAGRRELMAWLVQPADPQRLRLEPLLKLVFGQNLPPEANILHIEQVRREHETLLSQYRKVEERLIAEHGDHPGLPYWLLSLRCGLHLSQAYIAWCDETVTALERMKGAHHENTGA